MKATVVLARTYWFYEIVRNSDQVNGYNCTFYEFSTFCKCKALWDLLTAFFWNSDIRGVVCYKQNFHFSKLNCDSRYIPTSALKLPSYLGAEKFSFYSSTLAKRIACSPGFTRTRADKNCAPCNEELVMNKIHRTCEWMREAPKVDEQKFSHDKNPTLLKRAHLSK